MKKNTHTKIALSCISVRNFFSLLRSNASMKISHILAPTVTFGAFQTCVHYAIVHFTAVYCAKRLMLSNLAKIKQQKNCETKRNTIK